MSKKDYQAIARAIYQTHTEAFREAPAGQSGGVSWAVYTVAGKVADVLAQDNPRFDRARFIEACETGTCKGMPKRSAA